MNNNFNASFINGTLTAGTGDNTAGELFIHTVSAAANPLVIDSVIADNGTGVVTLTKGGAGRARSPGRHQYLHGQDFRQRRHAARSMPTPISAPRRSRRPSGS